MRTARRGKIIWSYMEPGEQAQTIRMIIEDQEVFYTLEAEPDGIVGAVNDCVNFRSRWSPGYRVRLSAVIVCSRF